MNDKFALLIDINDNVATLLDESFPNDKIQVKTKEGKIFDQIILIEVKQQKKFLEGHGCTFIM